jgi:ribosomal protein S18 acetylase RimI-like enzyme
MQPRDKESSAAAGSGKVFLAEELRGGREPNAEGLACWRPTPWDKAAFGLETFEAEEPTEAALAAASSTSGHYTVKMPALADTAGLAAHGFYYCDTLIEPYCDRVRFRPSRHAAASITTEPDVAATLAACHGAFEHGRFHRDFNIPRRLADLRYDNWIRQLLEQRKVLGLNWNGRQVGFFAVEGSRAVLHALDSEHRGRGLAKFLWTPAFEHLFAGGHTEVSSSVSASNLAVVNLYQSLGFRFRNARDLYHRTIWT